MLRSLGHRPLHLPGRGDPCAGVSLTFAVHKSLLPSSALPAWPRSAAPRRWPSLAVRASTAPTDDEAPTSPLEGGPGDEKSKPAKPRKGDEVVLTCERLAFGGKGVCRHESGCVVFCDKALPGETFRARIYKGKKRSLEGKKLEVLKGPRDTATPVCEHFGTCGGCKFQGLQYAAQLMHKESQVLELFQRVGGFQKDFLADISQSIVACKTQYGYRNKMEFSFSPHEYTVEPPPRRDANTVIAEEANGNEEAKSKFVVGLHGPGSYYKILGVNTCHLQHDIGNKVLEAVRQYCLEHGLSAFDARESKGFLRHLVIRKGSAVDDHGTVSPTFLINFHTNESDPSLLVPLAKKLGDAYPEIVGVVNTVIGVKGAANRGDAEHLLYGRPRIEETLRGLRFEISAGSFFQTNTEQAEVLYQKVEDACNLKGDQSENLLDLFCGTGTIGLSMARKVRSVYGYELVEDAVKDAKENAARNGISNAYFRAGDLGKIASELGNEVPTPDVVITDPNRPGMNKKLITWLASCGAKRIVYVSCNPSTQARDVALLCGLEPLTENPSKSQGLASGNTETDVLKGKPEQESTTDRMADAPYKLVSLQAVDMFPQTPHVESIAILDKNK